MDDISRQLGISKKTLYQHYPDKNELVLAVIMLNVTGHKDALESICGTASNAVEELLRVVKQMAGMMQGINPGMFYDLQKYHPTVWTQFSEFKEKFALEKIIENLTRGINEGLYRSDFNVEIIAKMRLTQIDQCLTGELFPESKFSMQKIMEQLTDHFMHGVLTLKGHKLLNKYKNLKEEE
jgi:AcrR family transcriptional regulator